MDEFIGLCEKYGTDKHRNHHFEYLYSTILKPFRNAKERVRLLEIGIESGASLRLWHDYLWSTHTVPVWPELFGIDIDQAACDNAPETAKAYCGHQSDTVFLQSVIDDTGGNFDVIVDDGGHGALQAEVSFGVLWPHLRVGGVYIVEDLEFSERDAKKRYAQKHNARTTVGWLLDDVKASLYRHTRRPPGISFLFCGEACAITKLTEHAR